MKRLKFKNKKCECCDVMVRDRFCVKHFKENRIKLGLCSYCGNKNTTTNKLCDKCSEKINIYSKNRYSPEKEHLRYLKRKPQILRNNLIWESNKYKNDMLFRLKKNLKNRFKEFLRNIKGGKKIKFSKMLGCEDYVFKGHIESNFSEFMNWDNYGNFGWHIDHIIPISFFDLKNEIHQKICNNYQNLRPLDAVLNLKKSDTIIQEDIDTLVIWTDDSAYILVDE